MKIRLITVPYDSGQYDKRMGAGPNKLLALGIADAPGHSVVHSEVRLPDNFFEAEVQAAVELDRRIAAEVRDAVKQNEFPLIISGNCNSALGTLAGLGRERIGVVWFDAHADFNTPETSPSGFFDGMALGIITGRCCSTLANTIPGFSTIPDNRIAIVGARQFDQGELDSLGDSEVMVLPSQIIHEVEGISEALDTNEIYLHIDLDVLDSREARINTYSIEGGLTAGQLTSAIRTLATRFTIRGAALTAFDPAADADGRGGEIALEVARTIVAAVSSYR